jgi:ubiquinone/menaquinone biosynthesis C-methylase UbiE
MAGNVYRNAGNRALLALIPAEPGKALDIGCGAGDNARVLRERGWKVWGVTLSPDEADLARPACEDVLIANVEFDDLPLEDKSFDVLIFSHVLEHMIQPAKTLARMARYLKDGGLVIIAVPNMAHLRLRWRFLRGNWHREDSGPMDRTHLQFFSFDTAPSVFENTPYELVVHGYDEPGVPMWKLRKVAPGLCARIDRVIGPRYPNLCTYQTLLVGKKKPGT